MKAEVAGLDDAGVDRSNGNLVRVASSHAGRPTLQLLGVRGERPGLAVGEYDAAEFGRLALIPVGGRHQVDNGGCALGVGQARDHLEAAIADERCTPLDGSPGPRYVQIAEWMVLSGQDRNGVAPKMRRHHSDLDLVRRHLERSIGWPAASRHEIPWAR